MATPLEAERMQAVSPLVVAPAVPLTHAHTTALQLLAVHKRFGSFVALRSVDLVIHTGELVCFLGPSGCGKTTLLRIIAGLEHQTDGRVVQNGRDVSNAPAASRDYGIVFQSYALFPNLTVRDNVAYGLVNRRVKRAAIDSRVKELLALVGLPDEIAKYPSQLSGGQQQRIALARALATSPSLLLLDEPLSALDAKERERLRGEIRQLQRRLGITTVMVTHDQEEALSMADRVVVMNHGGIEQIGTPLDIYEHPASPFVADFLGKVNVLDAVSTGDGRFRVGRTEISTTTHNVPAGDAVRLYLRPEDRILADSGPLDVRPNRLSGRVTQLDFHGTYCLATVAVEDFDGQRMLIYCSLNQALELGVSEGSVVPFALRGERVRVFAT
ncbi:MAG: putative 2-aminoethylphosphonate ABC transporter ATP-binding protein [Pseudomonadota bacterium]|nr:putative 2-aminoethylphosphonate ABC transporter ATP-binding protein [Pseudomonadota bacterium]